MDTKKSCTFRLSQTTRDRLKALAEETRLAQAKIIELLVARYDVEVRLSERPGV